MIFIFLWLLVLLIDPSNGLVQPKVRYTTTEGIEFLKQNLKKKGVKETRSGLQYRVINKSTKKEALSPNMSTFVHVNYVGKNIKGDVFDSSTARGIPTEMQPRNLIAGWQEALMMMKEGDQWQITVPAELGYRDRKIGAKISAGAVLVFDLELVKVVTEADAINPFGFISSLPELLWNIWHTMPAPLWFVAAYMFVAYLVRTWYWLNHMPKKKVLRALEEVHGRAGNPVVYLDIKIGPGAAQRVECELFASLCPRTVENFRCLCTGEKGVAVQSWYQWLMARSTRLHYKDSRFHRIIGGFMAQGGDIEHHDGEGGRCIYGHYAFKDEFDAGFLSHTQAGMLSMANCGPDSQSSQFFITFGPAPHCDEKHVVFGVVVRGKEVVTSMEVAAASASGKPRVPVVITDCGEVNQTIPSDETKKDK